MSCSKLLHIQGLRAIAIVGVLLFHLWPSTFPNGYLGVDMFFVISGYLMSQILSSSIPLTTFYQKRLHRILPSYLLTILATLSLGQILLMDSDFESLTKDALYSLTFTSNLQSKENGYFAQLSQLNLLLHSWSLSVEMQFYLLAPLLIWGVNRLGKHRFLLFSLLIAMGSASRLLQLLSTHSLGFSLMPARLWQFALGIGAHQWILGEKKEECWLYSLLPKRVLSWVVLLLMTTALLLPVINIPFHALFQFITTISTAILLQCDQAPSLFLLTNKAITTIGDSSYSLYLLHWPLIQFSKYYFSITNRVPIEEGLLLITSILLVSLFIHKAFDEVVRRAKGVILLIAILYLSCLGSIAPTYLRPKFLSPNDFLSIFPSPTNITYKNYAFHLLSLMESNQLQLTNLSLSQRFAINKRMTNVSIEYIEHYGKVKDSRGNKANKNKGKGLLSLDAFVEMSSDANGWDYRAKIKGDGNLSILLVGNSHADYIVNEIDTVWRSVFKQFNVFTLSMCLPIDVNYGWPRLNEKVCQSYAQAVLNQVIETKPDVLFINFLWHFMGTQPVKDPLSGDQIFSDIQRGLDLFQPHVKKIFIGAPDLFFSYSIADELSKRMFLGREIESLNMKLKDHLSHTKDNSIRFTNLRCPKCIRIDWAEAFCDRKRMGMCHAYDQQSQLAYFTDEHHYSFLGAWKVRGLLKEHLGVLSSIA